MTAGRLATGAVLLFVAVSLVVAAVDVIRDRAAPARADPAPAPPADDASPPRLVITFFHGHARCTPCLDMEAFTQEAAATRFGPDEGVQYRAVNYQVPGRELLALRYGLVTSTVVLEDPQAPPPGRWKDLTAGVWARVNDHDRFVDYLEWEARAFLAERRP